RLVRAQRRLDVLDRRRQRRRHTRACDGLVQLARATRPVGPARATDPRFRLWLSGRREVITQAPSTRVVLIATAFALSCIGLILFVWSPLGGSLPLKPRGYEVHVTFADASQLNPNADVRIAGVNVGKVAAVRQDGLRTNATLELDTDYVPLHRD